MFELRVIVGSTRPSRVAPSMAEWVVGRGRANGDFKIEVLDLEKVNLPFLDEPGHPRFGNYTKDHTRAWSEMISGADAFVMVSPEYNSGFAAPLKNAIDFLYHEWAYKPVGLVTYGGASSGMRGGQMLKQVLVTLRMMPLPEGVHVPFFAEKMGPGNVFRPNSILEAAADTMFAELARWAGPLKVMREKKSVERPAAS